jgi:hypothetical protein
MKSAEMAKSSGGGGAGAGAGAEALAFPLAGALPFPFLGGIAGRQGRGVSVTDERTALTQ